MDRLFRDGGDANRKRKLLEKQKEGNAHENGQPGHHPQEAFMAVLDPGDDG